MFTKKMNVFAMLVSTLLVGASWLVNGAFGAAVHFPMDRLLIEPSNDAKLAWFTYLDQQRGMFGDEDSKYIQYRSGHICIRNSKEGLRVYVSDMKLFENLASGATLLSSPVPIQFIYHGADERQEGHQCLLSFQAGPNGVIAANKETFEYLNDFAVGAKLNFWRPMRRENYLSDQMVGHIIANSCSPTLGGLLAEPIPFIIDQVSVGPELDYPDGFPEGIDCKQHNVGTLTLTLDINNGDLTAAQKNCLKAYHWFTSDLIKHAKCLKLNKVTTNEKKCARIWRRCIRRSCPAIFGNPAPPPPTDESENMPDLEEMCECWEDANNDGVNDCPMVNPGANPHVGHIPDTCIGGHPSPNGCYIAMDPVCNCALGRACGREILKVINAGNSCVYYNKIIIKTKDLVEITSANGGLTQAQINTLKMQKAANIMKFKTWINMPANMNCKTRLQDCVNSLPAPQRIDISVVFE